MQFSKKWSFVFAWLLSKIRSVVGMKSTQPRKRAISDAYATEINNIKMRLKDFSHTDVKAPDLIWKKESQRISVNRDEFPIPQLVIFLLNGVCGFPLGPRGDKTHWIVPFTYCGIECAFSHEKFGLRLYIEGGHRDKESEILGKLRKAVEVTEKKILTNMAKDQIATANITIANRFNQLGNIYKHFREHAAICYGVLKKEGDSRDMEGVMKAMNDSFRANYEGSYNALAMIDAFFSRLEHFLVLALAFSSFDPETDNLSNFVGKIWSSKFNRIIPLTEPMAKNFYDKLVEVKEKYRNTFAHGGFEKKGASFYFHLSGFGAIPANMSGHRNSVHFNLFPLEENSYNSVCALFDDFDNWLKDEALPAAWKFSESGLNLRFDKKYLDKLLEVSTDATIFEEWLVRESYLADMYDNADY
jgi:hypothetical protein